MDARLCLGIDQFEVVEKMRERSQLELIEHGEPPHPHLGQPPGKDSADSV